jgi:hypothetical protein
MTESVVALAVELLRTISSFSTQIQVYLPVLPLTISKSTAQMLQPKTHGTPPSPRAYHTASVVSDRCISLSLSISFCIQESNCSRLEVLQMVDGMDIVIFGGRGPGNAPLNGTSSLRTPTQRQPQMQRLLKVTHIFHRLPRPGRAADDLAPARTSWRTSLPALHAHSRRSWKPPLRICLSA